MWFGAGSVLWFFMISSFYQWWNIGGVIAGFILAPGVAVFPFIYWFMEGVFPTSYFVIWVIGFVGIFIASSSSEE